MIATPGWICEQHANGACSQIRPGVGYFFTLAAVIALSACSPAGNDPGPGGVTVDEARALEEAAAMIEARQPPPELLEGAPPLDAPMPPEAETPAPAEADTAEQ